VGLVELFLAVLVVGFSAINAGVPFAAWGRARDGRFALLGAGHLGLAALGAIWVWGAWPGTPPPSAVAPWPILTLVVAVVLLWFAATLWRPRR
jgi:formate hydrogenlyase subunit 4